MTHIGLKSSSPFFCSPLLFVCQIACSINCDKPLHHVRHRAIQRKPKAPRAERKPSTLPSKGRYPLQREEAITRDFFPADFMWQGGKEIVFSRRKWLILFYFIFVAAGNLWISGYYHPGTSLINKINCHCIFFYKLI